MAKKGVSIVVEPGSTRSTKTGDWRTFRPEVGDKCTRCGICVAFCPEGCIALGAKAQIDYDYCKGCGICARECPVKAIVMIEEKK
jgi:pyruvate ferredoxin oxidoreductase delta subunit